MDPEERKARLCLRQADILASLASDEKLIEQGGGVADVKTGNPKYEAFQSHYLERPGTHRNRRSNHVAPIFHPEFGRFMLEATPGKPWGIGFKDLLDVEQNMKLR
jgi:glutamate--cysteine ligase catalytic subunit